MFKFNGFLNFFAQFCIQTRLIMTLIDTHSHIYLPEFEADRPEMIERAEKEGVTKIIQPAIDSTQHLLMLESEKSRPRTVFSMMGLHPCSVKENYEEELRIALNYLENGKFYGIGETGLDFYWDLSFKDQQYDSFRRQIRWALDFDIPVVIHSRNSIDESIAVVKKFQKGKLKGVFHCFSGNLAQGQQIIDLGFYMGIGGVVTFKNSGLNAVIKSTGLDQVVLETDAPYLAPVPFRGKRNECSYLKYVVQKLSEITAFPVEKIAEITTANAMRLFPLR